MKKQILITGSVCILLAIAGICYSCSFMEKKDKSLPLSSAEQSENNDKKASDESSDDEKDIINNEEADKKIDEETIEKQNVKSTEKIYVHICGAVNKPDVYKVDKDTRLIDVITLAGGLSNNAAGDYVNQAQIVADGQRIYIPTKEEAKKLSEARSDAPTEGSFEENNQGGLVNINRASADELMELPGIGETKANSIVTYREANGEFQAIEDLMKIPGIKEGLFKKIATLITV